MNYIAPFLFFKYICKLLIIKSFNITLTIIEKWLGFIY